MMTYRTWNMFKKLCACCLTLLMATAFAAEPDLAQKNAIELVNKASAYLAANGRSKFLKAINTPKGEFDQGDLYVFVYDMTATMLAHPVNPKLVGRNLLDVPDPDGKYFRREIVALAKSKKSGWVDYRYKNPENGKIEQKTTYILATGDLILAAGIYKK